MDRANVEVVIPLFRRVISLSSAESRGTSDLFLLRRGLLSTNIKSKCRVRRIPKLLPKILRMMTINLSLSLAYVETGGVPTKTSIRAATWIGLVLVFMSGAANAQDYSARSLFKSTGQTGYSYDYSSRSDAEQAALDSCGENDCAIQVWFQNSCGALAKGDEGALGYSWAANNRSQAESRALSECGSNCEVLAWACTTR